MLPALAPGAPSPVPGGPLRSSLASWNSCCWRSPLVAVEVGCLRRGEADPWRGPEVSEEVGGWTRGDFDLLLDFDPDLCLESCLCLDFERCLRVVPPTGGTLEAAAAAPAPCARSTCRRASTPGGPFRQFVVLRAHDEFLVTSSTRFLFHMVFWHTLWI